MIKPGFTYSSTVCNPALPDGKMFKAVRKLCLEGIVSKKLDAPYKSGPSKTWLKIKNPNAPVATRVIEGTF
jgi:ATP-dependent DNA ligase